MLWEVDIHPATGQPDVHAKNLVQDALDLGLGGDFTARCANGYLLQGELDADKVARLAGELLSDTVVEQTVCAKSGSNELSDVPGSDFATSTPEIVYVLPKPGVTDPVAESAKKAILDFGIDLEAVRTFKKYWICGLDAADLERLCSKLLANDAIEQVCIGDLPFDRIQLGSPYHFTLLTVPIRTMNDAELRNLSKEGQLYLSLTEMQTIQRYFLDRKRDPTDIELETIAQTWSEHCSHKTLAGRIEYVGPEGTRNFDNMLKETIFAATVKIRKDLGDKDFCVSVFSDNAGVVRFDDEMNLCFKVETHNHPSALEPYGGANTGIGGVIRDPMGTGMGAKPICSTDVFCFAPPDMAPEEIPAGLLHPRRIIKGVVSGVRDYGNRMGIPTINGAVYFDKRYLGNPLVYCGNVGIIPHEMSFKEAKAGDWIVALGGRTGRDGIHGATFSSAELTSESETLSGGAVQIGNAITEKMVLDVMLQARDRGLYNAVTDCGAGGFSSAVGEMGEKIGADVKLENIPLKYEGLSYTEMWISEAQERMVFSVSPQKWEEFKNLCESEGVEAVVLGTFEPTGRLHLYYDGLRVADLDMKFLHDGRPPVVRSAVYNPPAVKPLEIPKDNDFGAELKKILGSLNVASKHWIIRQYDHEVQAGSIIKPLVGLNNDGPGDASVIRPRFGSKRGFAVSCGMNPHYGDFDTYHMAASAIDEAIRNCVAVGADPAKISILDNFCWGNTERPETLGSLVRSAIACYDLATGLGTPFISGKDSLNNEFRPEGSDERISIPPSLLISAMGMIEDVSKCVTMDFKAAGNLIYQVGITKNELGGSHFALVAGLSGGNVPTVDVPLAKTTFRAMHEAILEGIVRSAHDLSEGGMLTALAEMCFAGGFGADVSLFHSELPDAVLLFSESNTRFLCEVVPEDAEMFERHFMDIGIQVKQLGKVVPGKNLTVGSAEGKELLKENVDDLKATWIAPLNW